MEFKGWPVCRIDGSMGMEERKENISRFQEGGDAPDAPRLFLLSTRSGGLGLNLVAADTVIFYDQDWVRTPILPLSILLTWISHISQNPQMDLQAQDRAHRIGQTKAVRILRFITEKSVEEAMYARARYKLDIDDKVIQAGRFDNKSTQEEQEEFLVRFFSPPAFFSCRVLVIDHPRVALDPRGGPRRGERRERRETGTSWLKRRWWESRREASFGERMSKTGMGTGHC